MRIQVGNRGSYLRYLGGKNRFHMRCGANPTTLCGEFHSRGSDEQQTRVQRKNEDSGGHQKARKTQNPFSVHTTSVYSQMWPPVNLMQGFLRRWGQLSSSSVSSSIS